MFKSLATIFGVVFLVIGILGYIPFFAPMHSDGMRFLFGWFMVGGVHNVVHLLSGIVALLAAAASETAARRYFQVFGVIYILVTIIGFIQGDTVLGIFDVNTADNFLHLGLGVVLSAIGFGLKEKDETATA